MKTKIIIGTALLILMIAISLGCAKQQYPAGMDSKTEPNTTDAPSEDIENITEINPITKEPYQDVAEKRGYKTNITEFDELLTRASKIQSYKYNITDTGISDDKYQFFVLGRFVKMRLPSLMKHETGEKYDEILMDRVTKTAFSHCSDRFCPKPGLDKELEKVEYSDYYISDPMEYLYKTIVEPEYLKEEMLGNDFTKVFKIKLEGSTGKIWLQEYYGYPLKIEVQDKDGTKRKITFEDMTVDATRRGEIDLPFNFTVKGEGEKHWVFWEHYLGKWPTKSVPLGIPTEPALGV